LRKKAGMTTTFGRLIAWTRPLRRLKRQGVKTSCLLTFSRLILNQMMRDVGFILFGEVYIFALKNSCDNLGMFSDLFSEKFGHDIILVKILVYSLTQI
jgi:hypothetical protein